MKRLFGNESWIEAVAPSHNSDFSNLDLTLTFDFDLDLDSGLIIIPYYSHYTGFSSPMPCFLCTLTGLGVILVVSDQSEASIQVT